MTVLSKNYQGTEQEKREVEGMEEKESYLRLIPGLCLVWRIK